MHASFIAINLSSAHKTIQLLNLFLNFGRADEKHHLKMLQTYIYIHIKKLKHLKCEEINVLNKLKVFFNRILLSIVSIILKFNRNK